MLWIGQPPADRDRMVLVADDLPTLVRKAESIETKVLMNLLECQSDLLAKVSLETFAKDATQRRKMAELMVQSFQLLVRQVDHVPGKTGELMTKTHTMLEARQRYDMEDEEDELQSPSPQRSPAARAAWPGGRAQIYRRRCP